MNKPLHEKTELEKKLEAEAAAEAEAAQAVDDEEDDEQIPGATVDDLALARQERDGLRDQSLRLRAEFDNYRKRTARDMERIRRTAAESLLRDLLPVVDNLELALRHAADAPSGISEGIVMVSKMLAEIVGRHGLAPIEAIGQPFDPYVHEAMMQREAPDVPSGTVLEEFQKGYTLAGEVLRPSRVVVSMGGPDRPVEHAEETNASIIDNTLDDTPATD